MLGISPIRGAAGITIKPIAIKNAVKPRRREMINEQTMQRLAQMKLFAMSESIKTRMARSDHQDLSISDFLGLIVDDEWISRDNKRRREREASAKFKEKDATLENIQYGAKRGFTKSKILELAQLHWVKEHQNLAITGATGVGKSWIAQSLGHQACRQGLRVLFIRETALALLLMQQKATGGFTNALKRFAKIDLLILDDLGTQLVTEETKRDLFELIEMRYGIGSTLITSQLAVGEWHDHFGGGRIADSLCDRLVRNSHRIDMDGPSKRPEVEKLDVVNPAVS